MRAMVLEAPRSPLALRDVADPVAGPGQVVVRVLACGICRTDLHVVDGDLSEPKLPLTLGHQVAGEVLELGEGVTAPAVGDRVGVPWLAWADGTCRFCRSGRENLCPAARFTGYQVDGGYAERLIADARACLPVPANIEPVDATPLLCAGAIGYRALRMAGDGSTIGLYGFGNAARLVAQIARHEGRRVFAFTRPGDVETQGLARSLGCAWAGDSTGSAPEQLDAALLFAAVGELVPLALASLAPGGVAVCAEIHMSDIPSFPYDLLWHERQVRSVANLTWEDGRELLALAAEIGLETVTTTFALGDANAALAAARSGPGGTAVLVPQRSGSTAATASR
jgi:alcohol dehydrogenase, propanol-preferring